MKIATFLTAAFLTIGGMCSVAQGGTSTTTKSTQSKNLRLLKKTSNNNYKTRPNAPSRQLIACDYSEGIISITFALPEGECNGYLTNLETGATHTINFDSTDLIVDIETELMSEFYIEFMTASGNTYAGSTVEE